MFSEPKALVDPAQPAGATQLGADPPDDSAVQKVRSWTGLLAVIAGDIAIITAAIIGVLAIGASSTSASDMVAILTSAFTALGTLTTAYFGIRAVANTAQQGMAPGAATPRQ